MRANRQILRFNYDPEGIPQLRVKPIDTHVLLSLYGPDDPMQPGEVHDPHARYAAVCEWAYVYVYV